MSLINSAFAASSEVISSAVSTPAIAGSTAARHQGGMGSFIFIIGFFAIFYFMMIRPQMKRAKEHKQLLTNLSKDDEVVTSGGLLGRVLEVDEGIVTVEIANGTTVKVQKPAITQTLPKGTL